MRDNGSSCFEASYRRDLAGTWIRDSGGHPREEAEVSSGSNPTVAAWELQQITGCSKPAQIW